MNKLDPRYLGIDLGTSRVKALLLNGFGRVLGVAKRDYPVLSPQPGTAETDPNQWWTATCAAVREVTAQVAEFDITAIGLSGQMHGLVLTTADGVPTHNAITWADSRATSELKRWRQLPEELRIALTNPITPGMLGPILSWLQTTQPDLLTRSRWALLPKDWLRLQLTGEAASDPSDASATLLWHTAADDWAWDLLKELSLPAELLPKVIPSAGQAGQLTEHAAQQLGLTSGIPVAVGAGDTAAAALAAGLRLNDTLVTMGTGAQIMQMRDTIRSTPNPRTQFYCAAQPQAWYEMGAVQNAGIALSWVCKVLGASWDELYASIDKMIDPEQSPIFLPYLTGERTPILDSTARGTWSGLSVTHDREDLLCSAVFGVACAIRHAFDALSSSATKQLFIAGGGVDAPGMHQLLADVLNTEATPLAISDASAVGAALLAAASVKQPIDYSATTSAPITPGPHKSVAERVYFHYLAEVDRSVSQGVIA